MVRTVEEIQEEVTAALEEVKTWFFETYLNGHFQHHTWYDKDALAVRWAIEFIPSNRRFTKITHGVYTDKFRLNPNWDRQFDFSILVPRYKRSITEAMNEPYSPDCS